MKQSILTLVLLLFVSPVFGQGLGMDLPDDPNNKLDWENNLVIKTLILWQANCPELFDSLEWTPDQRVKLVKAIESINELDARIAEDRTDSVARNDRKKLLRTLREDLMDFQIKELIDLRGKTPMEAILKSELAGRHLELTDGQKKRIQDRSNKIAQEIRDFMQKKRAEAVKILQEELDMEQQEKLVSLVGRDHMNGFFQANSAWLAWHLDTLNPKRDKLQQVGWNFENYDQNPKTFWEK